MTLQRLEHCLLIELEPLSVFSASTVFQLGCFTTGRVE